MPYFTSNPDGALCTVNIPSSIQDKWKVFEFCPPITSVLTSSCQSKVTGSCSKMVFETCTTDTNVQLYVDQCM